MSFLAASPFLKALGWALVNSLWQFAICWLIYRVFIAGIQKLTAATRHTIALFLLFSGTVSFVAGLSWKYYANAAATGNGDTTFFGANTSPYTIWHAADTAMDAIMPYWSLLYLVCVVFLFIKFCLFVKRAGNLQNNGVTKMNALWRAHIKNISRQLGIQKEVKALLSLHIDTPQVIGFLKPVILLPAACLVNLSTEQLEAVLLHELVHIKRNDYLVNLFVTSVEILFFFNPFVKQMTASIRKEREYSCDDMVMQFQYHPHNYASALLTLEKSRMMPVTYGIAATGKNQQQLLTRIERILGMQHKQTGIFQLGACLMALLLLGFIATINPAKVAVDKFGTDGLLLADNTLLGLQYNDEETSNFTNAGSLSNTGKKDSKLEKDTRPVVVSSVKNNEPVDNQSVNIAAFTAEDNAEENNIETASSKETIDFSLPQKEAAIVPVTATPEALAEEPYVPANSFSYQFTQDTAMPKLKGETYNERMAKDALLKAQKAMAQINWQKIEKQFKYSRRDIAKLKNEIAIQIQNLNWQKINNEVKAQFGQEQLEKLQEAVKQDQIIKQYQQTEAYYEAMRRQLAEHEQFIKETEQRMLESQKAAGQEQKKVKLEMKKRKIIYI
jgi:beta-lactamase regulating signal transducer with metallopeptidase domain